MKSLTPEYMRQEATQKDLQLETIVLADNEQKAKVLCRLLGKFSVFKITGVYAGAHHFAKPYHVGNPRLAFFMIDKDLKGGFEAAASLKAKDIEIVLVTDHSAFAVDAYQIGALHYLVAPVMQHDIESLLPRLQRIWRKTIPYTGTPPATQPGFAHTTEKPLRLNTQRNIYLVRPDDLLCIRAKGPYCTFFTASKGEILVGRPIKQYASFLEDHPEIVKAGMGLFVNTKRILKVNKTPDGFYIVFDNDLMIETKTVHNLPL